MDQLPIPGVSREPPLWVCHARRGALLHLTQTTQRTICGEPVAKVLALTKPRQAALEWRCRSCYRRFTGDGLAPGGR